jgi:predicted alpha/beta hydrolase family esterase
MSAESPRTTETADFSAAAHISDGDTVSRWVAQLEEQVRRSSREAILAAFLVGGLLQVFAVRNLLINLVRLVLLLATPVLFGFAAWRLYQSFEGNENLRRSSIVRQRTAAK